ncbi:MAG: hypothetical protein HKP43_05840 [Altererythrobacter sp.]|nr:hypothetical protein [Altererythrobacter sp.]NNE48914.1 hypothetical protein [Altererythrobacter sp.]NNF95237.1 hypothetical protein [Altererythrobacter sp.]NNK46129.1 hypothetical protein [Altererythrobacter sp.]
MTAEELASERRRLAEQALKLCLKRGEEIPLQKLAAEEGIARARVEQIFADDDGLFESLAELWMEPHIAEMEDVLASDLPPNRKMYEFFVRRFRISRERYRSDPAGFALLCELGAARFEKVRSFVDLADHYLSELIAQAQADGYFPGFEIDMALSLINQMVGNYTLPDALLYIDEKLSEEKLAHIIDSIFVGLSAENGGASGVNTLRIAT